MPSETINDWDPETRSLLRALSKAGFTVLSAWDGEQDHDRSKLTERAFLAACQECEQAWVKVRHDKTGAVSTVFLFYGNSPGELVADYGLHRNKTARAALEACISSHSDSWEGRPQPKKRRRL